MSQQDDWENRYQLDPEHASELTRLIRQSRFMTSAQGGLFTEHAIWPASRVLDLACGPGDWALDLAKAHQAEEVEVIGIDISKLMIDYAKAQVAAARIKNATFLVGNVMQPLPFPDHYFEIVNARFLTFMPTSAWPQLLQECYRVLKTGGTLRLTECEAAISNSPAFEKLTLMIVQALNKAGQGFSHNGHQLNVTAMLHFFLESNGFSAVQERAMLINCSYGQAYHEFQYQNYVVGSSMILPFLLKYEITSAEEFEQTCKQMQKEMLERSFCAKNFMVTAWGEKP